MGLDSEGDDIKLSEKVGKLVFSNCTIISFFDCCRTKWISKGGNPF
jgi:hypothetical protein